VTPGIKENLSSVMVPFISGRRRQGCKRILARPMRKETQQTARERAPWIPDWRKQRQLPHRRRRYTAADNVSVTAAGKNLCVGLAGTPVRNHTGGA